MICTDKESEKWKTVSCSVVSDSWDPMDCSPPDFSVHGFFRHEYWSGMPFPTLLPTPNLVLTQGLNQYLLHLLHCRQNLYDLSYQGSSKETMNKTKEQPTKWGKLFANDMSSKGLITKIYKELIQLNMTKKWITWFKNG